MCGDCRYIWQAKDWPVWRYDLSMIAQQLAKVSAAHGWVQGRLADVAQYLREQVSLVALTEEIVSSSAIEGKQLDLRQVRALMANRLGLDVDDPLPTNYEIEGVVALALDATQNSAAPVTPERLFGWHAALFPTGYSGPRTIRVAQWRDDAHGSMQIVSGPSDQPTVHFEAPPAAQLGVEMERLLAWLKADTETHPFIKAGLLWLVTIYPFEDGNGRIARALGDFYCHEQTAMACASTAFPLRSIVIARITMQCWSKPRLAAWMYRLVVVVSENSAACAR